MKSNEQGYLYVLSNPAFKRLVKIGYTNREVQERVKELQSTGVPGQFKIEFYVKLKNAENLERIIHKELAQSRYSKEFFKISVKNSVKTIKNRIVTDRVEIQGFYGRSSRVYLINSEVEAEEAELKAIAKLNEVKREQELKREQEQKIEQEQAQKVINEKKRIHEYHWSIFSEHQQKYSDKLSIIKEPAVLKNIFKNINDIKEMHVEALKDFVIKDDITTFKKFYASALYLNNNGYWAEFQPWRRSRNTNRRTEHSYYAGVYKKITIRKLYRCKSCRTKFYLPTGKKLNAKCPDCGKLSRINT